MTYKKIPNEFGEPEKVKAFVRQFMSPVRRILSGKSREFSLAEIARKLYEGNYAPLKKAEAAAATVIGRRFVERISTEGSGGPTRAGGGTYYFYPNRNKLGRYVLCEDNFL